MSKNIKIILVDNENKKDKDLEEFEIEKPKTLEELRDTFEKKMKNCPDYYNLYYISNDKEINIQNNNEYNLFSNNLLYIRKVNPQENASTIFKKSINTISLIENKNEEDKIDDNDQIDQLKKEIKQKNKIIEENNKYIEKSIVLFKNICKKLNHIHLLINPEINKSLENIIKEISSEKMLKSYYDISKIISDEMDTFYEYLSNKLNKNSINEENIIENKKVKEKNKDIEKFGTQIKKKQIVEIKEKEKTNSKTEIKKTTSNLPYSCIPRIDKKDFPDITYDSLGSK